MRCKGGLLGAAGSPASREGRWAAAGTPGLQRGPQNWNREGAPMSAATAQQAWAGKIALVLCTRRGITEQFSISYCSKAYKIRSLAGISVTPP